MKKSTFAIESSCDDTSLAIVRYENEHIFVDKLIAYSQIAHHQQYGGVVPEIAFRLHSEHILALVKQFSPEEIMSVDTISVTTHPGLAGSLLVGKTVAHMLSQHYHKPLHAIHHIYGHIFSLLLERDVTQLPFPRIILTVSGGHNELYHIDWKISRDGGEKSTTGQEKNQAVILSPSLYTLHDLEITKLGKTLDDASGECFDKVARMMGGPYPGGQRMSEQASRGNPNSDYRFKRILLENNIHGAGRYDFSFSGMKAQAYTMLRRVCAGYGYDEGTEGVKKLALSHPHIIADIAYEFQEGVCDTLAWKLHEAVKEYNPATIGIVGGVSANDRLYEVSQALIGDQKVIRPMKKVYSMDNGAMIGAVGLLM